MKKNIRQTIAVITATTLALSPLYALATFAKEKEKETRKNRIELQTNATVEIAAGLNAAPPGIQRAPGIQKRVENGKNLPFGILKKFFNEVDKPEYDDDDTDEHPTSSVDAAAPKISAIGVSNLSQTSLTVHWKTQEHATSRVWYGTALPIVADSPTSLVENNTLTKEHSLNLVGLSAHTNYYFRVESADASGNVRVSTTYGVQTAAQEPTNGDTTAPILSAITVSATSDTSATINWNTDEHATSRVWYGTALPIVTEAPTAVVEDATLSTNHSLNLTGLTANTVYYFRVASADATGNESVSLTRFVFTNAASDVTPPTVIFQTATGVTADQARLIWVTTEGSDSKIWLSTNATVDTSGTPTASSAGLNYFHDLTITGLSSSTTYYYVLESADAAGNTVTVSGNSFLTLP